MTAAGETELRIEIPARLAGGKIRVQVRGRGTADSTREFVVMNAPVIARFSPGGGAPGTEVTLQGDHFGTAMRAVHQPSSRTWASITFSSRFRIRDFAWYT